MYYTTNLQGWRFTPKPCVSRGLLRAVWVWGPVSSLAWVAAIYGAARLIR